MAVRASGGRAGGSWVVWALCAAAVSLVLVEAGAGVEYVGAGLAQILVSVLGWMPALSVIPVKLAEQSLWHGGMLEPMVHAVPLGVVGFLIVVLGLGVNRQHRQVRRQDAKR